ncbi:RNA polymerase sigma subunit ECF family protein [Roseobacter cerasinus]|uniref:RNA polymerase sigma subunit ECF family protein n=1 Tax=Roseobacter cerasinus TaxID=2602289 RepID=A0A640VRL4_9RHOB|nr:RNA polymerase sigma factor [Roseobacter cerasinus]GFE50322.1 RNA polymerase sigma subunit ECF family protein [Roseobacter cerasinus]
MPPDADSAISDDVLLARYVRGDRAAARDLTARLLPRVYGHAMRLLGDATEAEDAAQEAMLRLWRTAPDWRPGQAQISTWLYRVTANLCMDRLRKRRPLGLDQIAEPEDPAPGVVQHMQDRMRFDALQEALDALPDRQRQAVVLRHIEGLSNPEIAQVMDIGLRAVESLTARGKRALRDLLVRRRAELGYEDERTG